MSNGEAALILDEYKNEKLTIQISYTYFYPMSTVEEIESAVEKLNKKELKNFRAWFSQHDAEQWDAQFESDITSGKLDSLAAEAIAEFKEGKTTEL